MNNNKEEKNIYLENNNRGDPKSPQKKFDFKLYKKNTINSLNQVEYFLGHFQNFYKYIKLYKILK